MKTNSSSQRRPNRPEQVWRFVVFQCTILFFFVLNRRHKNLLGSFDIKRPVLSYRRNYEKTELFKNIYISIVNTCVKGRTIA